jgi:hypothetical protein
MTPDQLLKLLEKNVIKLTTSFDLIDSTRDNKVSEEIYAIKTELIKRMGRNPKDVSLIDRFICIIIMKLDTYVSNKTKGEERCEKTKIEILRAIAENFVVTVTTTHSG